MAKKSFRGVDIKEVWNFRLSTAVPQIMRVPGGNWICQIWAKDNPDYDPEKPETLAKPLEEYDTGIPFEPGDAYDAAKVAKCHEWFYSRRDDYSLDNLELRKPVVAIIEDANKIANDINSEAVAAKESGDMDTFDMLQGRMKRHLAEANALIKTESEKMHKAIAEAEGA